VVQSDNGTEPQADRGEAVVDDEPRRVRWEPGVLRADSRAAEAVSTFSAATAALLKMGRTLVS
jgi:hypothetical protein